MTGPPGAGKSAVAGALQDSLGQAGVWNAIVEVDELERAVPPIDRDRGIAHLAAVSASFREVGYSVLIVTATLEDNAYAGAVIAATGADRHLLVRLEAERATLSRRVREREPARWSGLEALVAASERLAESMVGLSNVDLVLSTEGKEEERVAGRVAELMRKRGFLQDADSG